METENFGRRIRAYRKLKGFTQETFAKKLNVSISLLGEIERGNRNPSESILEQITQLLQVTIDDLKPKE
ncbi:transcriptional regulator [Lottiidibacillus patelloidae]|uniref:Transcriptional regulator n=1 Tax=Lottiidibacillus patelloidae TaxID=2670334 RepID=A0A263BPZ7_9BACI|nr:helix-turn-helix transcriptional regulator [Lottiidibacillus patelloidae]OZM55819.1 transcriptional regulator [Lottiidibacillus patelloidae]